MTQRTYTVRIDNKSNDDAISLQHPEISSETAPSISEGDYVQISNLESKDDQLVLKVTSVTSTRGNRYEVMVSKLVAELLSLNSLSSRVMVSAVASEDAEVEFAVLACKRQFVQRGHILRFKHAIVGRIMYSGQSVSIENVQAQIQELETKRKYVKSGIITPKTNIVFRSRSARIYWLIQISSEMWEMERNGNLYFERFLHMFVDPILDRWKSKDVTHSLSIVFFARTFRLKGKADSDKVISTEETVSDASERVSYQDYFKVVLENSTVYDKSIVIRNLKAEFWDFAKALNWKVPFPNVNGDMPDSPSKPSSTGTITVPSGAAEGNMLEAINVTFNVLDKHYMDRDLVRTGNSIVMVTAGSGYFKVDPKLAQITKQRMMDTGIGMDLVSLSQPPLHVVPLFHVLPKDHGVGGFYEVPHWINLQYILIGKDTRSSMALHMKMSGVAQTPMTAKTKYSESQVFDGWNGPPKNDFRWTGLEQLDADDALKPLTTTTYAAQFRYMPEQGKRRKRRSLDNLPSHVSHVNESGQQSRRDSLNVKSHARNNSFGSVAAQPSLATNHATSLNTEVMLLQEDLWGSFAPFPYTDILSGFARSNSVTLPLFSSIPRALLYSITGKYCDSNVHDNFHDESKSEKCSDTGPKLNVNSCNTNSIPDKVVVWGKIDFREKCNVASATPAVGSPLESSDSSDNLLSMIANGTLESEKTTLAERMHLHDKGIGSRVYQVFSKTLSRRDSECSDYKASAGAHTMVPIGVSNCAGSLSGQGGNLYLNTNVKEDAVGEAISDRSKACNRSHSRVPYLPNPIPQSARVMSGYNFQEFPVEYADGIRHNRGANYSSAQVDGNDTTSHVMSRPALTTNPVTNSPLVTRMSNRFRQQYFNAVAKESANDSPPQRKPSNVSRAAVKSSAPIAIPVSRTRIDATRKEWKGISTHSTQRQSGVATSLSDIETSQQLSRQSQKSDDQRGDGHRSASSAGADNSVMCATPPDGAGVSLAGSLDIDRDRLKSQPPVSYKGLFSLPLQEFQKRRYGINPFRREEGQQFMETRTHNRRRWAYAFSSGHVESNISTGYHLNYNSLCQPAVLPLATDYLPAIDDIRNGYTLSNYSLLLDPSVCPYRNPEALLEEMVNQRLAQEFQVVDADAVDMKSYKRFVLSTNEKEASDQQFIALSMGHRIQFLSYLPSRGAVSVHRYMSKIGVNDSDTTALYSYKIWSRYLHKFESTKQLFYQYPEPEYSWNLTDEVLLGNMDVLSEGSKAKRLRFAVIPVLSVDLSNVVDDYKNAFEKFLSVFHSYCDRADDLVVSYENVNTDRGCNPKKQMLNVKFWLAGKHQSTTLPQWAYLQCEPTYNFKRVFHFAIHWIVCIPALMDKFINNLFRRVSSLPLRIVQIPEYFCASNLQLHPFRAHPIIRVPPLTLPPSSPPHVTLSVLKQYESPTSRIEKLILMCTEFDWIPDEKQRTNWTDLGMRDPQCKYDVHSRNYTGGRQTNSRNRESQLSQKLSYLKTTQAGSPVRSDFRSRFMDIGSRFTGRGSARQQLLHMADEIKCDKADEKVPSAMNSSESVCSLDSASHAESLSEESTDEIIPGSPSREKALYGIGSFGTNTLSGSTSTLVSTSPLMQGVSVMSNESATKVPEKVAETVPSAESELPKHQTEENVVGSIDSVKSLSSTPRNRGRRHIHYDNQYMQRKGNAAVRVGLDGFVWLPSSTPRVSDCMSTKDVSGTTLQEFIKQCESVSVCYELSIVIIESFLYNYTAS